MRSRLFRSILNPLVAAVSDAAVQAVLRAAGDLPPPNEYCENCQCPRCLWQRRMFAADEDERKAHSLRDIGR